MRGSNSLAKIFENSATEKPKGKIKGRSTDLIKNRNLALLHRFYYYASFTELKYEKIIEVISSDFYLSHRRVIDILSNEAITLRDIRRDKPSIQKLKTSFVQFNWNLSTILTAPKHA